ncbi:MAG: hypothetical protein RIS79_1931, partial [Verrucomicrobiota bacterium]
VIGLTVLLVSSCSMPPRQAWQQIQTRGLIPFMMNNAGGAPLQVSSQRTCSPTTSPVTHVQANRSYVTTSPAGAIIGAVQPDTPSPSMLNSSNMPVAMSVPNLPGYVRSPFTNPPRLVDVRGMSVGSKVVCPYTHKPFLVPGDVSTASSPPKVALNSIQRRIDASTSPITPAPKPPAQVANSNVAALTKPQSSAPMNPNSSVPSVPAQPKLESTPELPYGAPISGRPGFVNSPYAAKHQLVDVTGLPVGMEVKCPYTGKLFRVPPQ